MLKKALELFFLLLVSGCALSASIKTIRVPAETVTGKFDLILFGGNYLDDPETIVFADLRDDDIAFEPYSPDYKYKRHNNLTLTELIHVAREHLFGSSVTYRKIEFRKIYTPSGQILGYEIRAIQWPLKYGFGDIPEVSYRLKDKKLFLYIRTPEFIENEGIRLKRRWW